LNKRLQGTPPELLRRVGSPLRLYEQLTALIADYKVRDFTRSSLLPDDLGAWKQAADGILHGSVVGLGWVLRNRPGALQHIQSLSKLLQLREDAVTFANLLSCLDL
jgi:hypothetical protein